MIKIENTDVYGWEHAIRGLRNPMNSWDKSDSVKCNYPNCNSCRYYQSDCNACEVGDENLSKSSFAIGENDYDLMHRLCKAGTDHRKFMRMIVVYADITAPLYWWKEYDTYKVGTVANSCSTMHKIHAKEFTLDDFSHEHLLSEYDKKEYTEPCFDTKDEVCVPIDGFPDYDISDYGNVYSWKSGERIKLKLSTDIDGYKTVGLYGKDKQKRIKVHRLVANAFIDKVQGKNCINHKDGNKWNNSKENLEWCTRSENSKHAFDTELNKYGSKQRIGKEKKRRFSQKQIEEIKDLYFSDHISQRNIGKMFGCDHSVISEIVTGKIYKDIIVFPLESLETIVDELNRLREAYLDSGNKKYWYSMIQLLPTSYNQKRTVMLNYEVLRNMYHSRKNHKLDCWIEFCKWIETLPYAELITND